MYIWGCVYGEVFGCVRCICVHAEVCVFNKSINQLNLIMSTNLAL